MLLTFLLLVRLGKKNFIFRSLLHNAYDVSDAYCMISEQHSSLEMLCYLKWTSPEVLN